MVKFPHLLNYSDICQNYMYNGIIFLTGGFHFETGEREYRK